MIRAAAALAASPLIIPDIISSSAMSYSSKSQSGGIKRFGDGRDWFFEKRYGMFIHWGIYSIPGWHEQHQWRARVPRAEYVKLAEKWNPVRFNQIGRAHV